MPRADEAAYQINFMDDDSEVTQDAPGLSGAGSERNGEKKERKKSHKSYWKHVMQRARDVKEALMTVAQLGNVSVKLSTTPKPHQKGWENNWHDAPNVSSGDFWGDSDEAGP